jgi:hypothetical protein
MPDFLITSPDGTKYKVSGPEGSTESDALRHLQAQLSQQPDYANMSAGDVATSAIKNLPSSAIQFGKDMAHGAAGIASMMTPAPVRMAQEAIANKAGVTIPGSDVIPNVANLGRGVLQKLGILSGDDAEKYADAVGQFLVDRYGSGAAIKKTLATDPVGIAADISTVLSAGGSAAARAPGVLGRAGQVAARAGAAIDPLGAPLKAAGKIATEVLGTTTGVGSDAIKTAYRAGSEGGDAGHAFLENLKGNAPLDEIVQDARGAVAQLRQERGDLYRADMKKVGVDDTVLDFDKINTAISKVDNVKTYKGQSISPKTEGIRDEIRSAVEKWQDLPPEEFHTAEGLDALKQMVGNIRDATQFGSPERVVANEVYQSIRKTITDQVPEYGRIMKGYEEASAQIQEIERTLSLKPNASIDTQLRKLLSALRDNVNTNYGRRKELVAFLARSGATNLLEKIAGRSLSAIAPRGLARMIPAAELPGAVAAAVAGHPAAAGALVGGLALSSPALAGITAYGAGAASRLPLRAFGGAALQSGRLMRAM